MALAGGQDSNSDSENQSISELNREYGELDEDILDASIAPRSDDGTLSIAVEGGYDGSQFEGRTRRRVHLKVSLVFSNLGRILKRLQWAVRNLGNYY